jgi:hypothetical protein
MKLEELQPHVRKLVEEKMRDSAANSYAVMEPSVGDAPLSEKSIARFNSQVRIKFIHHRNRLIDIDNYCCKATLDGLRHASILKDDSAEFVKEITHEQIKSDKEKTVITIEEI